MADIHELSGVEQARLLQNREISAVEILDAHLARIEEINPAINAVVTMSEEIARDQARSVDDRLAKGEDVGPLAGLPVGVKDTIDTLGIRTTYGSPLFDDNVPDRDDIIVQRLKAADAVIIGKTNTPEFATGGNTVNRVFGATRNPWNTDLSPGGSTGGGAAGLATGMFPLTVGSDLGGSLRIPASFCGIVGLRPTTGMVPSGPSSLPYQTLGVSGPMARSAEDIDLLMGAIARPHPRVPIALETAFRKSSPDLSDLKIAYVADVTGIGIDEGVAKLCRAAAEGFSITVETLDLSAGRDVFTTLRAQLMVDRFSNYLDRLDQLDENVAGNIEKGLNQTPLMIADAEAARAEIWSHLADFFEAYDALLTPTLPITPFPVTQNYPDTINGEKMASYIDWVASTMIFSLFGIPALSAPAGLTESGLPVGLQIVGDRFSESSLTALAREVQLKNPIGSPPI